VGLGGLVCVGDEVALAGSCGLHSRSDGREGGGEVGESRRERGAGVFVREGDKFDSSPLSLEGRDEGGVFLGLGFKFGFTA
jgi:hypothetical protein